ncbi:MAG TPA: RnfABCDGE type electron transport complex subunit G [Thermotogota bacterium]|nr:RnfABCDGE type electron transport complex subunit G [Thermotogota bacterium]HPJ89628.1 RnfABCDGE type electron transport complex subunit G [Thermotogota bacterium]HPR96821.1 RnfABCDGE type electron transport complex subunit G [Thermotogota bacterium]
MGNYLKMGLTLMAFAMVVAILLSAVYTITEDPIAQSELNVKLKSIKTVLTDPTSGELLIDEKDIPESQAKLEGMIWKQSDEDKLFTSDKYKGYCASPAYQFTLKDGRKAYVITGASVGYGGYVTIMCSFIGDADTLEMLRMEVLDYSQETPGLGAKIAEEPMKERFFEVPDAALKDSLKVDKDAGVAPAQTDAQINTYKDDGVIFISDLMTGATITPRGVANAINGMYEYLEQELGGE